MTDPESRSLLPIACTLTPADGAAQLAAWRAFNNDYLLVVERNPGVVTIRYAKVEDSVTRLIDLVRQERTCCAFAQWEVDDRSRDLRLTVTGPADAIESLAILD